MGKSKHSDTTKKSSFTFSIKSESDSESETSCTKTESSTKHESTKTESCTKQDSSSTRKESSSSKCTKCGSEDSCQCYDPHKICCLRDAVVIVQAEFIFLSDNFTGGATGGTPLNNSGISNEEKKKNVDDPVISGVKRIDFVTQSNGFFVDDCPKRKIICPAHTILAPPTMSFGFNKYPYDKKNPNTNQMQNRMIRASRILVTVNNVNNKGKAFVYEATLLGVDGAGDMAILTLDGCKAWNKCQPKIDKCHPYLRWGKSRSARCADRVYIIGQNIGRYGRFTFPNQDLTTSDPIFFTNNGLLFAEGTISDHRNADPTGFALQECVTVAGPSVAADGAPILDCQGRFIAMVTRNQVVYNAVSQLIAGPATFFMKPVFRRLVKASCSDKCKHEFVESIIDPSGAYWRYVHGYLGIAYQLFSGVNYDHTTDYSNLIGFPKGYPRVRLNEDGQFLNTPLDKQVVGAKILSVAGLGSTDISNTDNSLYYLAGESNVTIPFPVADPPPNSPVLGSLFPGDVIRSIDKCPIGDLGHQIPPALLLWQKCPGQIVRICYLRGDNVPNTEYNGDTEAYKDIMELPAVLEKMPQMYDYPWYAILAFPGSFSNVQLNSDFIYLLPMVSNQTCIFNPPV